MARFFTTERETIQKDDRLQMSREADCIASVEKVPKDMEEYLHRPLMKDSKTDLVVAEALMKVGACSHPPTLASAYVART